MKNHFAFEYESSFTEVWCKEEKTKKGFDNKIMFIIFYQT